MSDKNRYDVRIGNNNYVLKTTRSKEETDYIVKYVDTEIESAREQLSYRNPAMHATLACLNIADTLFSVSKDYDLLKKKAEEPMKAYQPLKNSFEEMKIKTSNADAKLNSMSNRLKELEEKLSVTELDRDNYKLELDRQINSSEKYREEIIKLRNKLLEQEKETLVAYKQLQEAVRNSEKK